MKQNENRIPKLNVAMVLPEQVTMNCFLVPEEASENVFRIDGYGGEFCRRIDGLLPLGSIIDDMVSDFSLPRDQFSAYIYDLIADLERHEILSFSES